MLEYYLQNPKYIVLVAVLAAAALFVLVKAVKSSAARAEENRKIIEKLKTDNELRNRFAILTDSTVDGADPADLFKGVALNLQKRVADKPNMIDEFDSLNNASKYIYSLYMFFDDGKEKMSEFFKLNTVPLTTEALKGFNVIIGGRLYDIFKEEFDCFDEDNEECSVIPSRIAELDNEAAELMSGGEYEKICGKYISENRELFLS